MILEPAEITLEQLKSYEEDIDDYGGYYYSALVELVKLDVYRVVIDELGNYSEETVSSESILLQIKEAYEKTKRS